MTEPESITRARAQIEEFEGAGVCPSIASAHCVSAWRCPECNRQMPPTIGTVSTGNYGDRYLVRCALLK